MTEILCVGGEQLAGDDDEVVCTVKPAADILDECADVKHTAHQIPTIQALDTSPVDAESATKGHPKRNIRQRTWTWVRGYAYKWRGQKTRELKHFGISLELESIWSFVNSFLGILAVTWINYDLDDTDLVMVIGSFGATAVLVYSAWQAPLAQPRNVIGGHVLSALVGVSVCKIFSSEPQLYYVASALAVALAIVVMEITGTVHPPGGATALIAVMGTPKILDLGYLYVVIPVLCGALIMLVIALVMNNLSPHRSYPVYWW